MKCYRRSRQGSGSSEGEDGSKKGSRKEKKKQEITEPEGVCIRKLSVVWLSMSVSVSRACKELSLTEVREWHVILLFGRH